MSAERLELSPSWSLLAAILILHALAAGSVLTVMQGLPAMALAAALLALGAAAAWARALHRSAASVCAIELSAGEMLLELRDGRRGAAEVSGARHVSRFMVALPVRRPVRRTVLVTRDMLAPEEFRRLRLWALWGKTPAHAPAVAHKQLPA